MRGESLWKTLLLWLPRRYLPARIRHKLGIYTYAEAFAKAFGDGFNRGIDASGLREWTERRMQDE